MMFKAFLSQHLAADAPSLVVPDVAVRAHIFVSRFAGRMRLTNRTEISSCAAHVFPAETSRLQIEIQASHHRAFHADAVLDVVNALRFASTRPTAGPSGIDDASARHVSGNYAMVVSVLNSKTRLTRESHRRMLAFITSVPHGTPSVRRHGQRSARTASARRGTASSAIPNIADWRTTTESGSSVRFLNCESRYLSRRIILRIMRCAEDAFTSGVALPWLD